MDLRHKTYPVFIVLRVVNIGGGDISHVRVEAEHLRGRAIVRERGTHTGEVTAVLLKSLHYLGVSRLGARRVMVPVSTDSLGDRDVLGLIHHVFLPDEGIVGDFNRLHHRL